jgi:hypothetical protein
MEVRQSKMQIQVAGQASVSFFPDLNTETPTKQFKERRNGALAI